MAGSYQLEQPKARKTQPLRSGEPLLRIIIRVTHHFQSSMEVISKCNAVQIERQHEKLEVACQDTQCITTVYRYTNRAMLRIQYSCVLLCTAASWDALITLKSCIALSLSTNRPADMRSPANALLRKWHDKLSSPTYRCRRRLRIEH